MLLEIGQVRAADVSQFEVFEVRPDALVRVEIGSATGRSLEAQALRRTFGQKGLDSLTAMNRRAVPNHQQLAGKVSQQMLEEVDELGAAERVILHTQQQSSAWGDATDDGQVVAGKRETQRRRVAAWRQAADPWWATRQSLIRLPKRPYARHVPPPFLRRPALSPALLDGRFVALTGAAQRLLRRPPGLPEQIPDVIEVVLHAELAANQLGDAASGPHIASKAKGLCPRRQRRRRLSKLLGRQSRRGTWRRAVAQSRRTCRTAAADPLAGGAFGHAQRCRNLALFPAFLLQIPGA
jgi:hypothetical protein